jgi:hypothetical protein
MAAAMAVTTNYEMRAVGTRDLEHLAAAASIAPITVSKMAGPIVGFPNTRLKPSTADFADLQPVTAQNPTDA